MQAREQDKPAEAAEAQPTLRAAPEAPPKKKRSWLFVVLGVLVVIGLIKGIQYFTYARSHVTTDNSFLNADITQVSPQVSGVVEKILVKENDHVSAGQLLAVIDDSSYQAAVSQAKANLVAAKAAKQSADADEALSRKTSEGQLSQARGGVIQAQSGIGMATADLSTADAAIQASRAAEGGAAAQAQQAGAAIKAAVQNRAKAVQAVSSARAEVRSAQAALKAAQAGVKSAQAHQTYAQTQATRFQSLAEQGAVSKQQAESARQDLDTASAALQSAEAQVASAESVVEDRQAALQSAQQGVPLADVAISQAKAGALAAQQSVRASAANLQQSISHRANVAEAITAAKGKTAQALGQEQSANTVSQVLAAKQAADEQAKAKVAQAQAALDQALLDLKRTKIYAPVEGSVNKPAVQEGATVQPGLPLLAIVRENSLYVDANLKETQTAKLTIGLPVEIDVDGFPAHPFTGHLSSLSPATGATFALLPPDNASGNFVKVVQRIPVRVDFDPGQPDLDRLRAGMSASVAIKTG